MQKSLELHELLPSEGRLLPAALPLPPRGICLVPSSPVVSCSIQANFLTTLET